MNKNELHNIIIASSKFKNLCINTTDFTDLLIFDPTIMNLITDVNTLKTKCFGYLGTSRLFVSIYVKIGNIMVSNYDGNPIIPLDINWSEQVELDKFDERYFNLKVFW